LELEPDPVEVKDRLFVSDSVFVLLLKDELVDVLVDVYIEELFAEKELIAEFILEALFDCVKERVLIWVLV
jgi:hypothetical protein